eukprot:TRINITY_DN5988_c0_g1_i1.p1 TRINITY_DN5988_c0_g1~~TRINITY_DN5988_c0_g1_i1.p1  ORF type:complete len:321 (+),score=45.43 TRINITY_DN5988_c0_g1_i1:26-964(+)
MIDGYGKNGMSSDVTRILEMMKEKGSMPSDQTGMTMKSGVFVLFVLLGCITADVIYSENFNTRASWSMNGTTYTTWVWSNISSIIDPDYEPDMIFNCPDLNCWSTPIPYGIGVNQANVISPSINASGFANLSVSFDVVWDVETVTDGANFAYSTNQGITWTVVGIPSFNDTTSWWYNQWESNYPNNAIKALAFTGQTYGWSGRQNEGSGGFDGNFSSPGWVRAYHVLPRVLNNVQDIQFQFSFGSDYYGYADGFAFDNFELSGDSTTPKVSSSRSSGSSQASGTHADESSSWKLSASMASLFVFFVLSYNCL